MNIMDFYLRLSRITVISAILHRRPIIITIKVSMKVH